MSPKPLLQFSLCQRYDSSDYYMKVPLVSSFLSAFLDCDIFEELAMLLHVYGQEQDLMLNITRILRLIESFVVCYSTIHSC